MLDLGCVCGSAERRPTKNRRACEKTGITPAATAEGAVTIIELMIVIMIILILAALILATSSYVQNKGARSRAETEIAAMSAALESYKADNGIYPAHSSSSNGGHALYQSLTGDGNDAIGGTIPSTGVTGSAGKSYM